MASSAVPASSRGGLIDLPPVRLFLVLALRQADDQTIERLADFDLAREPRVGLGERGEAENVGFLRARYRRSDDAKPAFIEIDMTGGAGAFAAAIGVDAGDIVVD